VFVWDFSIGTVVAPQPNWVVGSSCWDLSKFTNQWAIDLLVLAMEEKLTCFGTNFMDTADPVWELSSPHLRPGLDAYETVK
jgi:hypothetical protein